MNTYLKTNSHYSLDESGKGTVWAMLFSLALIFAYLSHGQAFLSEHTAPIIHGLFLIVLAIITVFSLGCGLHMALVGDRSDKEIRTNLRNQLIELSDYLEFAGERIKQYENQSRFYITQIRPIGIDCLRQARRVLQAIGHRIDETNALLQSNKAIDLVEADELMNKDLILSDNCMNSLIGTNPLPPIAPEEWIPTVNRLLNKADLEIRRASNQAAA
jgi:hypothetical protein